MFSSLPVTATPAYWPMTVCSTMYRHPVQRWGVPSRPLNRSKTGHESSQSGGGCFSSRPLANLWRVGQCGDICWTAWRERNISRLQHINLCSGVNPWSFMVVHNRLEWSNSLPALGTPSTLMCILTWLHGPIYIFYAACMCPVAACILLQMLLLHLGWSSCLALGALVCRIKRQVSWFGGQTRWSQGTMYRWKESRSPKGRGGTLLSGGTCAFCVFANLFGTLI